jgi:hypothetical protein
LNAEGAKGTEKRFQGWDFHADRLHVGVDGRVELDRAGDALSGELSTSFYSQQAIYAALLVFAAAG